GQVTPVHSPIRSADIAAGRLPRCGCGSILRPNVVWFGERLDPADIRMMTAFLSLPLDLLLVIGTSGEVSGGYGIPEAARAAGAQIVEINPQPSALSAAVDLSVRAPAA